EWTSWVNYHQLLDKRFIYLCSLTIFQSGSKLLLIHRSETKKSYLSSKTTSFTDLEYRPKLCATMDHSSSVTKLVHSVSNVGSNWSLLPQDIHNPMDWPNQATKSLSIRFEKG